LKALSGIRIFSPNGPVCPLINCFNDHHFHILSKVNYKINTIAAFGKKTTKPAKGYFIPYT